MQSIETAIDTIYKEYLKVKRSDSLLILADQPKSQLAVQFYQLSGQYTPGASIHIMPEIQDTGFEPEPTVATLMRQFDIVLLITSKSLSHSQARRRASRNKSRIVSLPNVQEESLRRAIQWPAKTMLYTSLKLADILSIGKNAHLTSEAGTDLTLSIARMRGFADTGLVHKIGHFSNLPAGEGCIAPTAGSANGVLIIDGSFPEIGLLHSPVRVLIKNGYAARISGEEDASKIRQILKPFGKPGRNIAELGIGTNPDALLTGFTLEDEKSLGTVHIGFGNNLSFDGKVNAKCHFDAVIKNPTLIIDGKTILEKGKMLI